MAKGEMLDKIFRALPPQTGLSQPLLLQKFYIGYFVALSVCRFELLVASGLRLWFIGEAWRKDWHRGKTGPFSIASLPSSSFDGVKPCRSDGPAILRVPNLLEEAAADSLAAHGRAQQWPSSGAASVDFRQSPQPVALLQLRT
jgi:hypothetical protein